MTKYLIVSDLHGAFSGAQAVEEAYKYHNCDYILCLGDILYHGPRNDLPQDYAPKKVIPIMNSLTPVLISVRGNCDAEVDGMVLDFPCSADYNILPYSGRRLFMSHGHIYGPDHLPKLQKNEIFLSGHTHIPTAEKKEGLYLLNPGSISLPKGGHPRTYAVLEDNVFTVYTLDHSEYMKIAL